MKDARNGPMYTHSDFRTSAVSRARAAAKSVRRASLLDLITLAKVGAGGPNHAPKAPEPPTGARICWRVAPTNSS